MSLIVSNYPLANIMLEATIMRRLHANEPQEPQNIKKMLRKCPVSNAWAAIF